MTNLEEIFIDLEDYINFAYPVEDFAFGPEKKHQIKQIVLSWALEIAEEAKPEKPDKVASIFHKGFEEGFNEAIEEYFAKIRQRIRKSLGEKK